MSTDLSRLLEGLRLVNTEAVARVLSENGVGTVAEVRSLDAAERDELYAELKSAKVLLGDRSKLRLALGADAGADAGARPRPMALQVASGDVEGMVADLASKVDSVVRILARSSGVADGGGTEEPKKKVMVTGFFDLLHSGHVRFLKEASRYGEVHVRVGSDENFARLRRGATPMFPELERIFMVQSVAVVASAALSMGTGALDFEPDLDHVKPDIFFNMGEVDTPGKREACEKRGVTYTFRAANTETAKSPGGKETFQSPASIAASLDLALRRAGTTSQSKLAVPEEELELNAFPWRICLAGGWLDQPWVSAMHKGPVIVVNIHPHAQFKTRSGLATSSRTCGMALWGTKNGGRPPSDVPAVELAKFLFGAENPPNAPYIAGSQDHLGLMLPGVNRLDYEGEYWPKDILQMKSLDSIKWLQSVLWLVPLPSRPDGYDPLKVKNVTPEGVKLLAQASSDAWDAIVAQNASLLGKALLSTMEAWAAILPETVPQPQSTEWCKPYTGSYGYLFSGAGGGFLMVVSEEPVEKGFQVEINTNFFDQWGKP